MRPGEQITRLDPTNRLIAVIDAAEDAERVCGAMTAMGIPDESIELVAGSTGAARLDPLGHGGGWWLRVKRLIGFMQADQAVDLVLYQAAIREGRVVVAVSVPSGMRARAIDALRDHGAHFINFYGTLVTEEIEPWRGERPLLPDFLQR